jgi:hypothetical protein
MTTATAINLDNITTGEAKLVLDKVIKQISEQTGEILIASDDVKIIAYALENNLQLRDYLMGLTSDGLSVESVANILRVMVVLFNSAELPAYPVETVLASYKYQLGDSDALALLSNGLARLYPLAQLLQRVMVSGLAPRMFATMANELHGKVVADITRTSELVVNERKR